MSRFLHLTTGPDNTNNALALAFCVLIVGIVIASSLWIMYHLNTNMMVPARMMDVRMQPWREARLSSLPVQAASKARSTALDRNQRTVANDPASTGQGTRLGRLEAAKLIGIGTTGVELAAFRPVQQAGYLAAQR